MTNFKRPFYNLIKLQNIQSKKTGILKKCTTKGILTFSTVLGELLEEAGRYCMLTGPCHYSKNIGFGKQKALKKYKYVEEILFFKILSIRGGRRLSNKEVESAFRQFDLNRVRKLNIKTKRSPPFLLSFELGSTSPLCKLILYSQVPTFHVEV
jgi:hypothetical protein